MGERFLHIAVGVLRRRDGAVLICQRPAHKLYPGEWEFPGGKVEPGETVQAALRRELHEELAITVRDARPLIRVRHRYPELAVELDTWVVEDWLGEPRSSEHPAMSWVLPGELPRWPLLAADRPIVNALRLPAHLVVTPPGARRASLIRGLPGLPHGALLRLRQPELADEAYRACARALAPACRDAGIGLIVDRFHDAMADIDAAGWHARASELRTLGHRPVPESRWFGASCHDAEELEAAVRAGVDYVLLGPVCATASHPGAPALGWDRFEALARAAQVPVFAIGGVGPADLEQARARGAQGVAGISAYWRGVESGGGSSSGSAGME